MFEQFIFNRFGIDLTDVTCIYQGDRIYLANMATAGMQGTQRRGLYIGKTESIYGPKPSLDFVLVYGHMATKNKAVLDDKTIEQLYLGNNIEPPSQDVGLIIVLDSKGRGAALGFANDISMQSLIPKQRQITKNEKKEEEN